MSGGYWNYKNNDLANEMFGWHLNAHYGEDGFSQAPKARAVNPMGDQEVSEMLWDMLCLLNSKDYCESGDISNEQYRKDLEYFKKKWFKRTRKDAIEAYKEDLRAYADELLKEFEK